MEGGEGRARWRARERGRRRWGSDRAERAAVRAASGRSDAGEEKAARAGAMWEWRYPGRSWRIYSPPRAPPRGGCWWESPVHRGPGAGWLVSLVFATVQ